MDNFFLAFILGVCYTGDKVVGQYSKSIRDRSGAPYPNAAPLLFKRKGVISDSRDIKVRRRGQFSAFNLNLDDNDNTRILSSKIQFLLIIKYLWGVGGHIP